MSKLIREGPWELRFLIVDRETGLLSFLTSNGVGKVVTIEPKHEHGRQIWYAIPVKGKTDWYTIVQDLGAIRSPGLARVPVEGSNKVILSEQPDEWRLEYVPIDIANGNVYKIHPPPPHKVIGVYYLLGKEGHEAVIQTLPVIPGNLDPAWQFNAVGPGPK